MSELFKGYINDVRMTVGQATRGATKGAYRISGRFVLLWAAIKNLFTGQGIWLSGNVGGNIGPMGLQLEAWLKKDDTSDWAHWSTTFDGVKAKGYINGLCIDPPTAPYPVEAQPTKWGIGEPVNSPYVSSEQLEISHLFAVVAGGSGVPGWQYGMVAYHTNQQNEMDRLGELKIYSMGEPTDGETYTMRLAKVPE